MKRLNELVLEELEDLFEQIFVYHDNYRVLRSCYHFAKNAHDKQTRDGSDDPYIIHPLRMVIRLKQDFDIDDAKILLGALLHDVYEDTSVGFEDVENEFGETIAEFVKDLTRERLNDETPKEKFDSKKRYFKDILDKDESLRIVKAVDTIDNMQDWLNIPLESELAKKLPRWLAQTELLSYPLARSLGEKYIELMEEVYRELISRGIKPVYSSFEK